MIKKTPEGNYIFPRLQKYKDLIHGVSSVSFGDMNFRKKENTSNIIMFAAASRIEPEKMMFMDQEHSKTVKEAKRTQKFVYKKVDSLITTNNIILNTTTADCVPLIFFDPVTRTIAIAHSGWKGTYKNIAGNVLKKLKTKKVSMQDVIVAIGPSIGSCCYDIDKTRAEKFKSKYRTSHKKFLTTRQGKHYLNLTELIKIQLVKEGVKAENIENSDTCTSHSSDFFSFRKQNDIGNTKVFLTSIGLV